jgi:hypothetical protein
LQHAVYEGGGQEEVFALAQQVGEVSQRGASVGPLPVHHGGYTVDVDQQGGGVEVALYKPRLGSQFRQAPAAALG